MLKFIKLLLIFSSVSTMCCYASTSPKNFHLIGTTWSNQKDKCLQQVSFNSDSTMTLTFNHDSLPIYTIKTRYMSYEETSCKNSICTYEGYVEFYYSQITKCWQEEIQIFVQGTANVQVTNDSAWLKIDCSYIYDLNNEKTHQMLEQMFTDTLNIQ